jgi:hypothetical protein
MPLELSSFAPQVNPRDFLPSNWIISPADFRLGSSPRSTAHFEISYEAEAIKSMKLSAFIAVMVAQAGIEAESVLAFRGCELF